MARFEYHTLLSTYAFRNNLGRGRERCRYYTLEDADGDVRGLVRDALRLADESGIDVAADLAEVRVNSFGCPLPITAAELRHNAEVCRRVLDALRHCHVDFTQLTGHSLAAYVLDADSEWCRILPADRLVRCHWRENFVGWGA